METAAQREAWLVNVRQGQSRQMPSEAEQHKVGLAGLAHNWAVSCTDAAPQSMPDLTMLPKATPI